MGAIVSASNKLISKAKQTVSPNSLKNCPVTPFKNPRGPNTAITHNVVAMTASLTSLVPSIAAFIGVFPYCSMWRKIFSRTTIASSMSSPTVKLKASKVMMLIVNPAAAIKINAPMSELGKARPVMIVDLTDPKKKNTTRIAKIIPNVIDSFTSVMFARIQTEPSRTNLILGLPTNVFKSALIKSILPFTASDTATVLEPDCLKTNMKSDFLPFTYVRVVSSTKVSTTTPTSLIRTGTSFP